MFSFNPFCLYSLFSFPDHVILIPTLSPLNANVFPFTLISSKRDVTLFINLCALRSGFLLLFLVSFIQWCPSFSAFCSICSSTSLHLFAPKAHSSITTFTSGSLLEKGCFLQEAPTCLKFIAICSSVCSQQMYNVPTIHGLLSTKQNNWSTGKLLDIFSIFLRHTEFWMSVTRFGDEGWVDRKCLVRRCYMCWKSDSSWLVGDAKVPIIHLYLLRDNTLINSNINV